MFHLSSSLDRELSLLKLETGVEEFLRGTKLFGLVLLGYQIFRKNCKVSDGLRNFLNIFQTEVKIMYSFTTKVSSVSALICSQVLSFHGC